MHTPPLADTHFSVLPQLWMDGVGGWGGLGSDVMSLGSLDGVESFSPSRPQHPALTYEMWGLSGGGGGAPCRTSFCSPLKSSYLFSGQSLQIGRTQTNTKQSSFHRKGK